MWKQKLFKALITIVFAVLTAILLTTKACWPPGRYPSGQLS